MSDKFYIIGMLLSAPYLWLVFGLGHVLDMDTADWHWWYVPYLVTASMGFVVIWAVIAIWWTSRGKP